MFGKVLISDFHSRGNIKINKEIPDVQKFSQLVNPIVLYYH
jgi:hypothetical protein